MVVVDLEPGPLGLHPERFEPAATRVVAHDEAVLVALRQRRAAREQEAAGPGADLADRRHDPRRLTRVRKVPQLLREPRAAHCRRCHRHRLIRHVPAAVAVFDHVHEARVVALVAVVVVGEQVAVLVEGEFLGVAQAAHHDFEIGAVRIAAEDAAGALAFERLAFLRRDVEAAVADGEVEFAVWAEDEPVEVVAVEGAVHAEAFEQLLALIRDARALGVLELPQVRNASEVHVAVVGEHAGREAIEWVVEPAGEHGAFVRLAGTGRVFEEPHLIGRVGEVIHALRELASPLLVHLEAVGVRAKLEFVVEPEAEVEGGIAAVLRGSATETILLRHIDAALLIDADRHRAREHRLGREQFHLHARRQAEPGHVLLGLRGSVR